MLRSVRRVPFAPLPYSLFDFLFPVPVPSFIRFTEIQRSFYSRYTTIYNDLCIPDERRRIMQSRQKIYLFKFSSWHQPCRNLRHSKPYNILLTKKSTDKKCDGPIFRFMVRNEWSVLLSWLITIRSSSPVWLILHYNISSFFTLRQKMIVRDGNSGNNEVRIGA